MSDASRELVVSLKALIDDVLRRGGTIWACPPCVKARGYTQETSSMA